MQYKKTPDALKPEHLTFLDDLRESGITNMFAAARPLLEQFDGLMPGEACDILQHWMDTFSERQRDKANESKPEAE